MHHLLRRSRTALGLPLIRHDFLSFRTFKHSCWTSTPTYSSLSGVSSLVVHFTLSESYPGLISALISTPWQQLHHSALTSPCESSHASNHCFKTYLVFSTCFRKEAMVFSQPLPYASFHQQSSTTFNHRLTCSALSCSADFLGICEWNVSIRLANYAWQTLSMLSTKISIGTEIAPNSSSTKISLIVWSSKKSQSVSNKLLKSMLSLSTSLNSLRRQLSNCRRRLSRVSRATKLQMSSWTIT